MLEKPLKVLVPEEAATETFTEVTESGSRLDDCAEVMPEEDLTANNLRRQLTPLTTKVLSHLRTQENNTALT